MLYYVRYRLWQVLSDLDKAASDLGLGPRPLHVTVEEGELELSVKDGLPGETELFFFFDAVVVVDVTTFSATTAVGCNHLHPNTKLCRASVERGSVARTRPELFKQLAVTDCWGFPLSWKVGFMQ